MSGFDLVWVAMGSEHVVVTLDVRQRSTLDEMPVQCSAPFETPSDFRVFQSSQSTYKHVFGIQLESKLCIDTKPSSGSWSWEAATLFIALSCHLLLFLLFKCNILSVLIFKKWFSCFMFWLLAAMPSVMERSGSGVLSRSRAKTATNGNSQHTDEESSDEEHSHGRPLPTKPTLNALFHSIIFQHFFICTSNPSCLTQVWFCNWMLVQLYLGFLLDLSSTHILSFWPLCD